MEGVIVAHEIIHQCKILRFNGYLLKLDFEKTYNTVN